MWNFYFIFFIMLHLHHRDWQFSWSVSNVEFLSKTAVLPECYLASYARIKRDLTHVIPDRSLRRQKYSALCMTSHDLTEKEFFYLFPRCPQKVPLHALSLLHSSTLCKLSRILGVQHGLSRAFLRKICLHCYAPPAWYRMNMLGVCFSK